MTEGLLPAVERSSEEETATVVGTRGPELRTPAVERSSGEKTVTEGLFPTAELWGSDLDESSVHDTLYHG